MIPLQLQDLDQDETRQHLSTPWNQATGREQATDLGRLGNRPINHSHHIRIEIFMDDFSDERADRRSLL